MRTVYERLSKELSDKVAWTADVFVDESDATRESAGKLSVEIDYDWWWALYKRYGRELMPMAEISAYGTDAVLRIRTANNIVSERVLAGENFLHLKLETTNFEILKQLFHSLPPNTPPGPGDEAMVFIYVRASLFPSVDLARRVSSILQARVRQKRTIVLFRTDAYFIDDNFFPIVYRFDQPNSPPSLAQHETTKTMICSSGHPGITCDAY
jgi:hypothetical protein